jgi:hypothetical protein
MERQTGFIGLRIGTSGKPLQTCNDPSASKNIFGFLD